MTLRIQLAETQELPVIHAILTLCGEHMHRVQGMSHWHPYGNFERFQEMTADGKVYGVYLDEFLAGCFYLSEAMPHYATGVEWAKPNARALYGGKFAILPMMQKRGVGAMAMQAIDNLLMQEGYEALRFDAVSHNKALIDWYSKLGYQQRGSIPEGATFFEKSFPL